MLCTYYSPRIFDFQIGEAIKKNCHLYACLLFKYEIPKNWSNYGL